MQSLDFCTLIKRIFKTDLQKDEISRLHFCPYANLAPLKAAKKNEGTKIIALVWKLIVYQQSFWNFWKAGWLFDQCQKNYYKSCLFRPNHLELGTIHLWTWAKILTLVTWSKWWRQHYFWRRYHLQQFFLSFKFFFCLKFTVFFKKSNYLCFY